MTRTYRVTIDISRLEDRGERGDPWDRWCDSNTLIPQPVTPLGASHGSDQWDVEARRPRDVRTIVRRYARATDCDVDIVDIQLKRHSVRVPRGGPRADFGEALRTRDLAIIAAWVDHLRGHGWTHSQVFAWGTTLDATLTLPGFDALMGACDEAEGEP